MNDAFRIGRIAGIDIRIHWSWFAIFFLLIWWLAEGFYGREYKDWSTAQAWTASVISTLFFFSSVLVHELSHSLVAKRLGLPVTSITLFIFGGVSSLGAEPASAGDEFKVAIVGPATSFGLGALFGLIALAAYLSGAGNSPVGAITQYLAVINVAVGIFNMLPGFPLDGGRVLRSALWARADNMIKATRWATMGSTAISFGLMALGILITLTVKGAVISGVWLIVIGWFLRNAAESSYQQLALRNALEGIKVQQMVNRTFHGAPPDIPLTQLVNEYMVFHSQRAVPIIAGEELLGLVSMGDLKRVPAEEWASTSAFRAMTPFERLFVVQPQEDLARALEIMAGNDVHQVPVMDGRVFLGFVTRADLLRLVQIRSDLGVTRAT
jgi:Zn-dependent protease/CBS domain-containing protein